MKGLESNYDYIAFMDDDDYYPSVSLKKRVSYLINSEKTISKNFSTFDDSAWTILTIFVICFTNFSFGAVENYYWSVTVYQVIELYSVK